MGSTKLKIGRHWSIQGGSIADSIRRALVYKVNAIQIYLGGNQNKTIRNISDDEASEILELRKKHNFYLVVHGKLIYNFCADGRQWQIDLLINELTVADKMGADVVIHQGKNVNKLDIDDAIDQYVKNLEVVLKATSSLKNRIILENSAHQGTEIGYTIEELATIYKRIKPKYKKRIGFCLDTCHIFVAGEMDLRVKDSVVQKLQEFEKLIGIKKLKLFHLNDSKSQFNSKSDRHGSIMAGHIGSSNLGGSLEGLYEIITYAKKHKIPVILETPNTHTDVIDEIEFVKSWTTKKYNDSKEKHISKYYKEFKGYIDDTIKCLDKKMKNGKLSKKCKKINKVTNQ